MAGLGLDGVFHFEHEKGGGDLGGGELAALHDVVDAAFFVVDGGEDFLLAFVEVPERGGFARCSSHLLQSPQALQRGTIVQQFPGHVHALPHVIAKPRAGQCRACVQGHHVAFRSRFFSR